MVYRIRLHKIIIIGSEFSVFYTIFLLSLTISVLGIPTTKIDQNLTRSFLFQPCDQILIDKKPKDINPRTFANHNNFDNLQEYFESLGQGKKNKSSGHSGQFQEGHPQQHRSTSTRRPGSGGGSRRTTRRHSTHRPHPPHTHFTERPNHSPTPPHLQTQYPTSRFTTRYTTIRFTRRTTTTTEEPEGEEGSTSVNGPAIDFTWIILCAFLIFTMQTGFGLLECGIVSPKNETNIMLKNVADVVLGGFTYWIFGYGITYGTWKGSSPFFGFGYYAVDSDSLAEMGDLFTSFFFQLSFATTATTIVSGALAERCNFKAYCLYSLFATITYSVQARWIWGPTGFLGNMGAIDIAGSGAVHLVGGTAAFVAAWMLGPRLGRYDGDAESPQPGNNMNILLGLFNLWWAWFAFNAGSTYGVVAEKWKFSARAAVSTVVASLGGGMVGLIWGFLKPGKPFGVLDIVNAVLGSLVGITAGCALFHTPEAFITGCIGALVALIASLLPDKLHIDDPVGATAVHGFGGMWGMLSVGFFADLDGGVLGVTKGNAGLFRGGSGYLLGVQAIAVCCIVAWSVVSTFIILLLINLICPLRVSPHEELIGLDFCEHGVRRRNIGTSPAISLFGSLPEVQELSKSSGISGQDLPAHGKITEALRDVKRSRGSRRVKSKSADSRRGSGGRNERKIKSAAMFARAFRKLQSKGNRINPRDRQYIFDEYKSPLKSSTETLYPEDGIKEQEKEKEKKSKKEEKEEKAGNENRIFQWTRNKKETIQIKRDDSVENLKVTAENNESGGDTVEKLNEKNKMDFIP